MGVERPWIEDSLVNGAGKQRQLGQGARAGWRHSSGLKTLLNHQHDNEEREREREREKGCGERGDRQTDFQTDRYRYRDRE